MRRDLQRAAKGAGGRVEEIRRAVRSTGGRTFAAGAADQDVPALRDTVSGLSLAAEILLEAVYGQGLVCAASETKMQRVRDGLPGDMEGVFGAVQAAALAANGHIL